MTARLFFFGRTPQLSLAELQAFAPQAVQIRDDVASVVGDISVDGQPASSEALMRLLGGTVKIAEVRMQIDTLDASTLLSAVDFSASRITFGLSGYGVSFGMIKTLSDEMKDLISERGGHARFILPKEGSTLTSVVVEKEDVCEIDIIATENTWLVAKTVAVQPFASWSKRDYDRPYADAKSGMLPPKVSRMIINMALGADARGKTLLDPFCGMGTVLAEALLRGVSVIGSDIDEQVKEKAKKNIAWVMKEYAIQQEADVYAVDATHISGRLNGKKVEAIATEPFLGSSRIGEGKITDPSEIADIVKGLDKLYIGCLKEWTSCLTENGVVVMAIPSFAVGGRVYSVKKVVDTCENLGYTKLLGPIAYGRPQAIVQRNFYIFRKN